MPFQKGQSGNPAGRPPGSRNRADLFAEVLLEGEAEMILRNAIRAAVNDVPWAVRLCVDRLSPRLRTRAAPIAFELPPIKTLADIPPAIAKISSALAAGDITIDEAERYTAVLERWSRMLLSAEPNGKPSGKIEFVWLSPDDPAAGPGNVPDADAAARGLPPIPSRAIDNPDLAVNEGAKPGRAAANPDRAIDNPIVVSNADAEPGRTARCPDRVIDNPIVINNGDAASGGQPPIPSRAIDNSIVDSNGDAQPGPAAIDSEPESRH